MNIPTSKRLRWGLWALLEIILLATLLMLLYTRLAARGVGMRF